VRPGAQFAGRYRIESLLGQGGSGAVFRARDELFGGLVALKLAAAPDRASALRTELEVLADAFHPRLARVLDLGVASDGDAIVSYHASELVEGEPLDRVRRSYSELAPAIADLLDAIRFLHSIGIRHNDVSPANVLLGGGRATLIDLGCAGPLVTPPSDVVSGTPGFIAPERLEGEAADGRADLYSIGATLRAVLGDAPAGISALVERLCARAPRDRPSDAGEVIDALGLPIEPVRAGAPPKLVGRERELEAIDELLERLAGGTPGTRVLVLGGAPESGRTRLVREAKRRAQLRVSVVEGSARPERGMRDLLRRAVALERLPDDPIEAALACRDALARRGPTALVLDDADHLAHHDRLLFDAFAASIDDVDPIAVIATSGADDPLASIPIAPLDVETIARLRDPPLARRECESLFETTGGLAGSVVRLLERRSGDLDSIASLSAPARVVLARVVAAGGRLDSLDGIAPTSLAELRERGLVLRHGPDPSTTSIRLARPGDLDRIERQLPIRDLRGAHRTLAERAVSPIDRTRHLALAGDAGAGPLFCAAREEALADPSSHFRAAVAVARTSADARALLLCAELFELAGDPVRGLGVLAKLRRSRGSEPHLRALYLRAGSIALKLGNARRALRHLARASAIEGGDARERALLHATTARALLLANDPARARDEARAALATDPGIEGSAKTTEGLALAYLGDIEAARRALERAKELEGSVAPRERVRLATYRAIVEYRAGALGPARELYRDALGLAEAHGLSDQIPSIASSLAALHHRRGEYGPALAGYDRALRYAKAIGKARTIVSLEYNRGQAYCDVGLFDRARRSVERTRALAERHRAPFFANAATLLSGEIALYSGRTDDALADLARAAERFDRSGASREALDAQILHAEAELRRGAPAREALAGLRARAKALGADDLAVRADLVAARASLARGEAADAIAALEQASARAAALGTIDLEAECEAALAAVYASQRADHAARARADRALERWDRCAASLEPALREAFLAHPRRALSVPRAVEPAPDRERFLERVLAVNARINQSLKADDVLSYTMDAAVDLAGAERGFVILRQEGGELDVRVARNLDRERVDRAYLKFSRTIAERVIESGEPLLTTDAASDERFATERSVQALRLRSILCVPIRAGGATIGALYLENRFERGRFRRDAVKDLLGFADQAGIALANARLYAELESERARIAALLERRTREVDRLSREVRLDRSADTHVLVGRSAAMKNLRALIDRVRDTPVTVLVHGESGSGKELVARAIHGKDGDEPFVSVSCAALPETLLESELFGHVRGAFTGADRDREGLFSLAGEGTLFLDEVGEIPLGMQAKLLRAIQEREIRALGSSEPIPIRARIVSATNRVLRDEVRAGRFREDLFYRLAVVEIAVPPLRDRLDDLVLLARHVLARLEAELGRPAPSLAPKTVEKLMRHAWPGNVRELENVLSNAMVLATGSVLEPRDVVLPELSQPDRPSPVVYESGERAKLVSALEQNRWNVSEVARALSIPRATLYRKLKRYQLARR
jgi:transcriptional regulator with GAF, ATPase, and Fis domain/serine/threonine protein kinase